MVRSPDDKPIRPHYHNQATLEDEIRLFPSNLRSDDPNGVPIIPGQTMPKRKKIGDSPFKIVDRISGKARQSGPVRASKKEIRPHETHPYERPTKRPRHRAAPEPSRSGSILGLVDKETDAHPALDTSPPTTHPSRMSPTSSHRSAKLRKTRNNLFALEEFRGVEKNVKPPQQQQQQQHRKGNAKHGKKHPAPTSRPDDAREERFTEDAAAERRRRASSDDGGFSRIDGSKRAPKHEVLRGVEISPSKNRNPGKGALARSPRQNGLASPTRTRDPSESQDSPDELQVTAEVRRSKKVAGKGEIDNQVALGKEHRQSSPADIQHTVFTPSKTKRGLKGKQQKYTTNKAASTTKSFGIIYARFGPIEQHADQRNGVELLMDLERGVILLHNQNDPAECFELPLSKVTKATGGLPPSGKIRLLLSKMEGLDQKLDLELSSAEEKERFSDGLRGWNIEPLLQDEAWLEKAFHTHDRELKQHPYGLKRPLPAGPQRGTENSALPVKRMRLSDSLQDERGNPTVTAPRELPGPSNSAAKSSPSSPDVSPRASKLSSAWSVQIPVKVHTSPTLPASNRQTRAMLRRLPSTTIVSDDDDEADQSTQSQSDGPVKKWHKPLVYPRFGKKKAEVNMQDRDRLRKNDEFLNDNLIEFYIRFLQEHLSRTNEDVAKRVYFFNSFFYDTLMNVPRGKKGINYDGVQKWTRNVDIFNHDFVVVPINEHAHWYVAIICNLPNLQDLAEPQVYDEPLSSQVQSSSQLDSQVQEIPETPPPEVPRTAQGASIAPDAEPAKEEQTRHSLASMTLADEPPKNASKEGTPVEEWPDREEVSSIPVQAFPKTQAEQPSSQTACSQEAVKASDAAKASRKQATKRTSKADVNQPTIITFDSLGVTRSPTSRILRDYLYEEAKSKKGVEINTKLIRGITAQKIPLQPNYSDCGLYLLAYLEKFVQDPDTFIRKILQKEDGDWPPLKSGHLRKRLRKFLDALYDEQEQMSKQESSAKETMADRKPICYLLGSPWASPEAQRGVETESPMKATGNQTMQSPSRAPEQRPDPESPTKAAVSKDDVQVSEQKDEAAGVNDHEEREAADEVRLVTSRKDETGPSGPHPTRQEVIEVPDSQEPAASLKAKSETTRPVTPVPSPSKVRSEVSKRYTPLHLSAAATESDSKMGNKDGGAVPDTVVETQVPGTPSKSLLVKDSPSKK
ncbi:cysteine proteinase [Aspergillus fijiensis CBS 313.89]|uniref:Cysteine proteinase n=1 Tax=Aspergillus fijiensis CBS 313.89 TaxID=1448319 RepID=A0A8G1S0U7_9EURO|nr:cysteine proteinase [Aspergillus fijiensis CBS 313.89]RAK80346.1 cysteine proteinase [Aspergillus fijiensis CBS 313.89]